MRIVEDVMLAAADGAVEGDGGVHVGCVFAGAAGKRGEAGRCSMAGID